MKYLQLSVFIALSIGFTSCSVFKKTPKTMADLEYQTTESGITYKILRDKKAGEVRPIEGDYVEIFIQTYAEDSLIFDSKKETGGKPVAFPIKEPQFKGDLTEALYMLTVGDSGIFLVPVDTLKASGQKLQPWMKEGKSILYSIKLDNITTMEELRKRQQEEAGKQPKIDDEKLQAYFKERNISPEKTESGLYILKTKEHPDADKAIPGQKVTVNYKGYLMDGTVFDSNLDPKFNHVQPFEFVLGRGNVIRGWDEGIALLRKGEKATLYIPSGLAYGKNPPNSVIPVNGILIFDVELLP